MFSFMRTFEELSRVLKFKSKGKIKARENNKLREIIKPKRKVGVAFVFYVSLKLMENLVSKCLEIL